MTDTLEQKVELPVEENVSPVVDERFRWFAVFTQSGFEKKAKQALDDRIKKYNYDGCFKQVVVPSREVDYIDANGKKKKREQKMMPGYLLIQMEMNDKTFHFVRETPKITNFVGADPRKNILPAPMADAEVERLFATAAHQAKPEVQRARMTFEKGERVKVIDGPFTSFLGDVDEVKADKQKLRILVSVFGRATPVEIEFSKVEKVIEDKPSKK
jgi:transcriptional antiterminator NusG